MNIFSKKPENKKIVIAGIILIILVGLIFSLIPNSNSNQKIDDSKTGIKNDSGKSKDTSTDISKDKIEVEKVGLTKAGDLVVKVTNKNEASVCLSYITANFKDNSGKFALKADSNSSFVVIPSNSSTLVYFWGYDENYAQYPNVSFNVELANISDDFASSGIELSSNNTGSQIAVTLKNNSGKSINSSEVIVIYYSGNEIVGAETGYDFSTVPNGSEAYINVEYPDDSNYDSVAFDKYEVYYVNASFN